VGSGLHAALEALSLAATLVASGDADAIVVAAVDEVGPTIAGLGQELGFEPASGAVALLVSSARARGRVRLVSHRTGLGIPPAPSLVACGHRALLPLLEEPLPTSLAARSVDFGPAGSTPLVGWAELVLEPSSRN
jgi:hypothetical protein